MPAQKQKKWAISECGSMSFPETPTLRCVCGCDHNCYETFNLLLQDWPAIEKYIKELTLWFTTYIEYEGEPVIHNVIRAGLDAYAKELYDQESDRMPHRRVFAYLEQSLRSAARLSEFKVLSKKTHDTWNVLSDTPFAVWRLGKRELSIEESSSLNHETLLAELYRKTLPPSIKKVFWRHNYEEVFMGDGSDCRA